MYQPFDLVNSNRERRPGFPASSLFIGGYSMDGSKVGYGPPGSDSHLVRLHPDTGAVLGAWPDLWTWLLSEIERLSHLFDEQGRKKDPRVRTG